MKRLANIITVWQDYLVLSVVLLISVMLILLKNDSVAIGGIRGAVIGALAMLQRPVAYVTDVATVMKENQQLKERNAALLIRNSRLAEAYLENQRLRSLLEFDLYNEYDCTPAKVLGRQGLESVRSITIDVGSEEGIQKYMPIIAADGLVGITLVVNKRSSIGQILQDRNFRVGARIQRNRVEGIVKWAGDDRCILTEVHRRADVKVGDVVITSNTSALFLPGIKIGVVVEIDKQKSSLFQNVFLKPSVDFSKLEEVFIVREKK